MKRSLAALAVALGALFTTASCNDTNNTFQPNTGAVITFLSPADAYAGRAAFTLTVNGGGFVAQSVVQWNGQNRATTFVSTSQVTAAITAADIATAGTVYVNTLNPSTKSTDNGLSNSVAFIIHPGPVASHGATGTVAAPLAGTSAAPAAVPAAVEDTPALSADGRYVAYAGTQGASVQIFLRDTCTGAATDCQPSTRLLSVAPDGTPANGDSHSPALSADGRYAAFSSAATNLVVGAPAGRQVYLRDTCLGAALSCTPSTQLISTDPAGGLLGAESILPSISSTGRFVAFLAVTPSNAPASSAPPSGATGINSGFRQVFIRDTCLGVANCTPATTRLSLQPGDVPVAGGVPPGPALSAGGQFAALADASMMTLFTRAVAVSDAVFLAAAQSSR
ncbi:MAG: hypothetical protein LAN84_10560 [Acidobacteriia bacterium]|nr:hypothetical protein [Terriglobia bacterium]